MVDHPRRLALLLPNAPPDLVAVDLDPRRGVEAQAHLLPFGGQHCNGHAQAGHHDLLPDLPRQHEHGSPPSSCARTTSSRLSITTTPSNPSTRSWASSLR